MTLTMLDKPLGDLRREVVDLRQLKISRDYDINKLGKIITVSKDSLRETETFQRTILQQLQQFEISLADINEILRANIKQKVQLEQQQKQEELDNDIEIRAKLMTLNAEALECRAAAVQLQQEAKLALVKAAEIEKHANEELTRQAHEMKLKQQQLERERAAELERRVRLEEERQRLNELQIQQQQKERLSGLLKMPQEQKEEEDEYADWKERDFMNTDQCPQCIFRLAPNALSIPIEVKYLEVSATEYLLDDQEELISTPMVVNFDTTKYQQTLLLAIPYISKRSNYRENVIKIRQSSGIWKSINSKESTFDSYKEKHFVECKLEQSTACAVVSRLKQDKILIDKHSSGRFSSDVDPRLTMEWPANVCSTNLNINLRVLPVDLPAFTQFTKNFSSDCQGLIAVGPIIELQFDTVSLLKPIKFTLPILVQTKQKVAPIKPTTVVQAQAFQETSTTPASQQELILQQQQSIFKSMLGDDSNNERLVLLFSSHNENMWHIDSDIHLSDSKIHDTVTTNMQNLHSRMIIARYDRQFTSTKQLQTTINLLEESLNQRIVSLILRRRLSNLNEICFVCCSSRRINNIDRDLQADQFIDHDEQIKELILQEGQLLELRFRGNVVPIEYNKQSYRFAFNTYFPFYFQTNVSEIDKYSQHLSPFFYGFVQIFSRTIAKEHGQKKHQIDATKQQWREADVCQAELVIRLPKPSGEVRAPTPKTLTKFTPEGILTPLIFHELSASLVGDEWCRLARRLGMTKIRIEALGHEYAEDAGYYMLLTWFKRAPHSIDKDALLINALTNIKRWDIAQELELMKEAKRQEQRTSSRDDQLRIFNVAFTRICQHDECIRTWKQIARELMLSNEDIQRIEEQYLLNQERCLRSLELWASDDSRADIKILARMMRSLGFRALSRELGSMV
ncbi:unnamed protein product [Rotaria socialis]|uniref:Death domain-containing protein n=1 Tax=Rotaria socialis TaxID=392032 RepID=A0A820WHV1_9BILA|nr:unnamed protein product [Rotaria socialis]CAF3716065.1 unnamed protein product [Rotaria socialis]CAF4353601.1 unnamed protein product [Rotaria socialis]CAF4518504.1 unnamed protein product [Rotaria socialis]